MTQCPRVWTMPSPILTCSEACLLSSLELIDYQLHKIQDGLEAHTSSPQGQTWAKGEPLRSKVNIFSSRVRLISARF